MGIGKWTKIHKNRGNLPILFAFYNIFPIKTFLLPCSEHALGFILSFLLPWKLFQQLLTRTVTSHWFILIRKAFPAHPMQEDSPFLSTTTHTILFPIRGSSFTTNYKLKLYVKLSHPPGCSPLISLHFLLTQPYQNSSLRGCTC